MILFLDDGLLHSRPIIEHQLLEPLPCKQPVLASNFTMVR